MMKYFWIDGHCDTLLRSKEPSELERSDGHFDFFRARQNGGGLQIMALFPGREGTAFEAVSRELDLFEAYCAASGKGLLCRSGDDLRALRDSGDFGVMLSLEGADAIDGDLSRMELFFERGVRVLGLTWNGDNALCGGIGGSGGGLTALGREGVRVWEELGGIVDVSHASVQGFWDVMETAGKPVIASHSCCAVLCDHRRNLTDKQLLALAEKGGVIGVNFYPVFLADSGVASVEDVVNHIEYAVGVCGEDSVGIGSDFDGIESTPAGLSGVQDLRTLAERISERMTDKITKKVIGANFFRVLSENIK